MTVYIAVGFAAAAVLWLIIWSVKGLLLTPVKLGRSTKASVLLTVSGASQCWSILCAVLCGCAKTER